MVREAAGTNPVVLVKGALEEFVRVTVLSRIFKVAGQKLVAFPFTKCRRLFQVQNRVFTIFICFRQCHRSNLAWVGCAFKCDLLSHVPGEAAAFQC